MIENRTRFTCSFLHSYTLKVDFYFYGNLGDFSFLLLQDLNKKYDLTVAKTINLNTVERPCYEGEDYNDQEYLRLAEMIRTEVGCTSPFVPPQLRAVQCSPLLLIEDQGGLTLIGREVHSVAPPALLCHKEPARASKAPY